MAYLTELRRPPSYVLRPPAIDSAASARKRARAVIALYAKTVQRERLSGNTIGGRSLKRKIIPPRDRPLNLLKREIYRVATEVTLSNAVSTLKSFVSRRDGSRYSNSAEEIIDWSIRLVVYQRPVVAKYDTYRAIYHDLDAGLLLNRTAISRLSTELRFAWTFGLRWQLVDMFVDHVGGYELISAYNNDWAQPCSSEMWISYMTNPALRPELIDERDEL